MILTTIKKPLRYARNHAYELYFATKIKKRLTQRQSSGIDTFDFKIFRTKVLSFIQTMQTDETRTHFKYSASCTEPTLYASVYACMTISMLGALDEYSKEQKRQWAAYFDSFQDPETGLFFDPAVANDIYRQSDWWGARHLALHMLSGYTDLGMRPKYPFKFLKKYYRSGAMQQWLSGFNWESANLGVGDIDNKIMNIGCMLQFQRDAWSDTQASSALEELKTFLREKLSQKTGMWGRFDPHDPNELSRMIQFAYHLFPIFFFDKDFDFDIEKIVKFTLQTQNKFGGYGVKPNSSACEDIDSIDLLVRLYQFCPEDVKAEIERSIKAAFGWVMINQVQDGGFVFRLDEAFTYGAPETSSISNEGAMLPTWFRTLSIMYITRFLKINQDFTVTNCPGYEFV